jgi:hypothetical protein
VQSFLKRPLHSSRDATLGPFSVFPWLFYGVSKVLLFRSTRAAPLTEMTRKGAMFYCCRREVLIVLHRWAVFGFLIQKEGFCEPPLGGKRVSAYLLREAAPCLEDWVLFHSFHNAYQ